MTERSASADSDSASVADELRKLANLLSDGYLTDDEFVVQKEAILDASQGGDLEPKELTADELEKLADLVRTNVLTRDEFEAQKYQLLWSVEEDKDDLTAESRWHAAVLLGAGAAVTTVALFPAYYGGGVSLSSSAENLGYNIPFIVGMILAAGLLLWPRAWPVGAGVACAVVLVDIASFVTSVGAVVTGQSKSGTGFLLGCVGCLIAVAGAFLAVRELVLAGDLRLQSGPFAAMWSVLGLVAGSAWAIGLGLPDSGYHLHLVSGTFKATGTAALTDSCCNAFSKQPADAVGQSVALIVLAVGLPILAACLRWFGFGRGLLVGAAIALSAEWFSSLPARTQLAPADFGWTAANAARLGFTASWFYTTGFILLGAGTLGLFLLATTRLLLRR